MTEENEQSEQDEVHKIIDAHCNQLAEHFDSVQIFVTRHEEDGGTRFASRGTGNWFAREGQVRAWVKKQDCHINKTVMDEEG